ncbi:MAG: cytochrome P450 [Phyllobacteriaceae bacterium]|nr:cytochrome P450 [Phyllobacteriaceae bacterium]
MIADTHKFDPITLRLNQNIHDADFIQSPYRAYAAMHQAGGRVFWEQYGFWCFANYADVNSLLRDKRFGREVPPGLRGGDRSHLEWFDRVERYSLLEMEPPGHTRLRRLVNRAFVSSHIERLKPEISRLSHALIDGFEAKSSVDLLPAYATPVPLRVIAALMGVLPEMEPLMLDWSHAMVRMYTLTATRAEEDAANEACRQFHGALSDLLAHKRRHPADDLLTELCSGGIALDEAISTAVLLMNAGHEATVHQTGNAVLTLLNHAENPAALLSTPDLAAQAIEEALRFDAPLHLFTRYAKENVDFGGGVQVAKGQQIGLLLGAANRDPLAFEAADSFVPARRDQRNVTFGAGIHFCIGAPLARMEMAISVATLFERLPRLALAEQPRFADTFHFHGLETLIALPQGK